MGNTVSRIMASMEIGPHTSVEEAEKAAENQIPVSHLIKVALGSAVGFWLLAKGSTYLARDTAFFNRLSAVKQRRFPTYMTSLVHAAVGAAWAWYKVGCKDAADVHGNRRIIAFALGYFVNDLWATQADWLSHPQDLLHHVCGIGLLGGAMMKTSITEYVPRFLILESSTVFLDLMWLLKESQMGASSAYTVCSTAFASLFFATRVAWMPYAIMELANNHPKKWKGLGLARYSLYPLCALQYYWFYRILLMLTRKR